MTPDAFVPPGPPFPVGKCDHCEACGSEGGTTPLLEIPLPVEVLEQLGLSSDPLGSTRLLCADCVGKGLRGSKLTLLELVKLAPHSVKQEIHAFLIRVFEI